jgi:hypothetical protein
MSPEKYTKPMTKDSEGPRATHVTHAAVHPQTDIHGPKLKPDRVAQSETGVIRNHTQGRRTTLQLPGGPVGGSRYYGVYGRYDPSPGGVAQLVERVLYHSTRRAVPERSWVRPSTEVEPGFSTFGGMLVPVLQLISPVCKTGTSLYVTVGTVVPLGTVWPILCLQVGMMDKVYKSYADMPDL